jgi:hypothetical protein
MLNAECFCRFPPKSQLIQTGATGGGAAICQLLVGLTSLSRVVSTGFYCSFI